VHHKNYTHRRVISRLCVISQEEAEGADRNKTKSDNKCENAAPFHHFPLHSQPCKTKRKMFKYFLLFIVVTVATRPSRTLSLSPSLWQNQKLK